MSLSLNFLIVDGRVKGMSEAGQEELMERKMCAASLAGVLDGYRFGNANNINLKKVVYSEGEVLKRGKGKCRIGSGHGYQSWSALDANVWSLVWEWDCSHSGMQASRCSATVIINRSVRSIQISRVQIKHGKNLLIMGSEAEALPIGERGGYEAESRAIAPGGSAVVFVWGFSPSPLEVGHIEACISTSAFSATVSSIQKESCLEPKGGMGFTVGFLEKSVSEWWSKYVLLIT